MPRSLKDIRKSKNLSQAKLAKLMHVHMMTIRKYESGKRKPPEATVHHLALVLGVDFEELMLAVKQA